MYFLIGCVTFPIVFALAMIVYDKIKMGIIYRNYKESIKKIAEEAPQRHPWLAKELADIEYVADEEAAKFLKTKKHPAYKAAEKVSEISKQKRLLKEQNKLLEYQLNIYENAFPWLLEFKELSVEDAYIVTQNAYSDSTEEYEYYHRWLSPAEYKKLSSTKRNQLALDRYCCRAKTKWDIGIEFERYIGYKYECQGYTVKYNGALEGLNDMGVDLIAENGDAIKIIQCKRWIKDITVHEKTIMYLYGSTEIFKKKFPNKKCEGIIVTTTTLTDFAKKCADILGIVYFENEQVLDYPMVKCNISKNGERIYHLPFDQQYDKVRIAGKDNCLYVKTVAEAEKLGFRHAYKWRGSKA